MSVSESLVKFSKISFPSFGFIFTDKVLAIFSTNNSFTFVFSSLDKLKKESAFLDILDNINSSLCNSPSGPFITLRQFFKFCSSSIDSMFLIIESSFLVLTCSASLLIFETELLIILCSFLLFFFFYK